MIILDTNVFSALMGRVPDELSSSTFRVNLLQPEQVVILSEAKNPGIFLGEDKYRDSSLRSE